MRALCPELRVLFVTGYGAETIEVELPENTVTPDTAITSGPTGTQTATSASFRAAWSGRIRPT